MLDLELVKFGISQIWNKSNLELVKLNLGHGFSLNNVLFDNCCFHVKLFHLVEQLINIAPAPNCNAS